MKSSLKRPTQSFSAKYAQIAQKVTYLQAINQYLKALLPAELKGHCEVANIEKGRLLLFTQNAHWLTPLRFHLPELLPKMKQKFPEIKKIETSIFLPDYRTERERPAPILTQTARQSINACAKTLEDEALKNALKKLAKD